MADSLFATRCVEQSLQKSLHLGHRAHIIHNEDGVRKGNRWMHRGVGGAGRAERVGKAAFKRERWAYPPQSRQ